MPTARPTKEIAQFLKSAPSGMWYESRTDVPMPFVARWRDLEKKKHSRAFADEPARAAYAADWARERAQHGRSIVPVDARTMEQLAEFRRLVDNTDMLLVAREWLSFRATVETLTVTKAWEDFHRDQSQRNLSEDTHSHRKLHGERICARWGGWQAAAVKSEDLDAWLASLVNPETGLPMSAKSKAHHLKNARHFFEWLKARRKIAHNPADAVTAPDATVRDSEGKPVHRDINILTVEQARTLMAINRHELCIGRLALELFGGLRFTSAARLRREDIDWDERGIVLPGHKHKSGTRHYVDGWPDNLFAWLKISPAACWDLHPRTYAEMKRMAFAAAGLKPPAPPPDGDRKPWTPDQLAQFDAMKNAARHSFITYHLAGFKDVKLTAYLATKTSVHSLNNDYRGRATKTDGVAYFQIVP